MESNKTPHPSSLEIADIYERNARQWDADRSRSLMELGWLQRFTAVMGPTGAVLDLGCGSGEPIAAFFIGSGCQVTGVDASPTLIGLCRERFPNQTWLNADMRSLALGRKFQGLLAWDSFFHLPPDSQRLMFAVFRDHAAGGAALMFTSGPEAGEAIGEYRGRPLYHASLDPREYEDRLGESGFTVVDFAANDPTCGGRTVWLGRYQD